MKKQKQEIYLDDLSGAELLNLILEDHYALTETSTDIREEDKAQSKAIARRLLKKMREKENRISQALEKENKKIAFLLEGDRLKEAKRCAWYQRIKEWNNRHDLANRNNDSGGGGSVTSSTTRAPSTTKFCSTCGFSHL